MKLFSNQCQNKWRQPAVPPSHLCHDCLITSLPERGGFSGGCSGTDFICFYGMLENPDPAWSSTAEVETSNFRRWVRRVWWDGHGEGGFEEEGPSCSRRLLPLYPSPPNQARDGHSLGNRAILFPSRLPSRSEHPQGAPWSNWDLPRAWDSAIWE